MPDKIQRPDDTSAGLYVAGAATPERLQRGLRITTCARCGKICCHNPRESIGHEIICLGCGNDVPAIRKHLDKLAKGYGE